MSTTTSFALRVGPNLSYPKESIQVGSSCPQALPSRQLVSAWCGTSVKRARLNPFFRGGLEMSKQWSFLSRHLSRAWFVVIPAFAVAALVAVASDAWSQRCSSQGCHGSMCWTKCQCGTCICYVVDEQVCDPENPNPFGLTVYGPGASNAGCCYDPCSMVNF